MSYFFRASGKTFNGSARSAFNGARKQASSGARFFHKNGTTPSVGSQSGFQTGSKSSKSAFNGFNGFSSSSSTPFGSTNQTPFHKYNSAQAPAASVVQADITNNALASTSGSTSSGGAGGLIVDAGEDDDSNMHIKVFRCILRYKKQEVETAVFQAIQRHVDGVNENNWKSIHFNDDFLSTKFRIVNDASIALKRHISNKELNYIQNSKDLFDVLYTVPEEDSRNPYSNIDRIEVMFSTVDLPPNVSFKH